MIKVVGTSTKIYRRVTCGGCASILEFLPGDVERKVLQHIKAFNIDLVQTMIICPKCRYEIKIDITKWKDSVR